MSRKEMLSSGNNDSRIHYFSTRAVACRGIAYPPLRLHGVLCQDYSNATRRAVSRFCVNS